MALDPPKARPAAPTPCPPWCLGAWQHDGDPRHSAEMANVPLSLHPGEALLWLDLVQGPDDDQPFIAVHVEEEVVARLTLGEAGALALKVALLIEQTTACPAGPVDRRGGDDPSQASAVAPPAAETPFLTGEPT